MTHKLPHGKPSVPGSEPLASSSSPDDVPEATSLGEPAGEAVEKPVEEPNPDPYDELWDPDMDIRPERIRKTRVRSKVDTRPRGGGVPRGKRREGV
jgi:hypothetical protein